MNAFSAPSLYGQDVDFQKEILPIFQQHCYECHGDGNKKGGLSLESIAGLQKGGHSGSPIFAKKASDSELFLRISSLAEGYRMPKRGEPLSQPEISKIAKWIFQNADLANQAPLIAATDKPSTALEDQQSALRKQQSSLPLVETSRPPVAPTTPATRRRRSIDSDASDWFLNKYGVSQLFAVVAFTAIVCFAICWICYRSSLRSRSKRLENEEGSSSVILAMALGALSSVLIVYTIILSVKASQLIKENEILRSKTVSVQGSPSSQFATAPVVTVDADHLPLPPYPMHPPRLGGNYYRGNDERDETLFNGGFYRTATVDLRLINDQDEPLRWGDAADGKLFIEIEITRAAKATRELFTDRIADLTSVKHYSQVPTGVEQTLQFEVLEKEDRWRVKIPLPDLHDQTAARQLEGMVYLMYGNQPGEQRLPRPHFGVKYDLHFEDSQSQPAVAVSFASTSQGDSDLKKANEGSPKIRSDSVLWMGSMYTLNNRVLVPNSEQVLLDRWFDWRPIPEIEGDAAEDPALIGTPEHLAQ